MGDAVPARTLKDAAHELNNLCSTILGFATLAEETDPESTAAAYLKEIQLATEGVAAIAKWLQELSGDLETLKA